MLNQNHPFPRPNVAVLRQRLSRIGKLGQSALARLQSEVSGRFPEHFPRKAPASALMGFAPIREPQPAGLLKEEVANLPAGQRLFETAEAVVYCAMASQMPRVVEEIGRLREITFRLVGEGTGKSCDLDEFDVYYEHLFVWNKAKEEIVGAYRLGRADEILKRCGKKGLYTHTLFKYKTRLFDTLGPALELGRSFVRPEYQRTPSALFLLWKGIGQFIVRNPRYSVLFGPVSISNEYTALSRRVMVEFLNERCRAAGLAKLVKARRPFHARMRPPVGPENEPPTARLFFADIEEVSRFISAVEPDKKAVPVLVKQYCKLGARFLAFHVDEYFCDSLDALIVVDLRTADRRMLERIMGEAAAGSLATAQSERVF